VWEARPGNAGWLMLFYVVVEIAISSYTVITCKLRSLKAGTIVGGTGFFLGLLLARFVFPISTTAGLLLVPYLLWSPIGTYVTWQMMEVNYSQGR
jgi:benzodiazapine receptor